MIDIKKSIVELEKKGYFDFPDDSYYFGDRELAKLGYICNLNFVMERVELIKTDFDLAEQIQRYERKEITPLEIFKIFDNKYLKDIYICQNENSEEPIFRLFKEKEEKNKFSNPYEFGGVKTREEIIDLLKNGAYIRIFDESTIIIFLEKIK